MRTYAPRGYYPGRPFGGTRVTTTPRRQATEKQLVFLGSLHKDRQFDEELEASYQTVVNVIETHGSVPMNVVSDLIDRAKASPWKRTEVLTVPSDEAIREARTEAAIAYSYVDRQDLVRPDTEEQIMNRARQIEAAKKEAAFVEGMWIIGSADDMANARIFKVQKAVHGSGNLYGKELVNGRFEYFKGARRLLLAEGRRMTLEEAKAYGALYGTCCVCGRTLTNETSIEAGIDPVCAGRL